MDLIDIKIENGRFAFDSTGDLIFVKGVDRVRQQVEFRLSLWAGEWFLDETFGTPYLLRILGKAAVSVDAAVDALRQQMLDVEGVQSINRLDYTFDAATRKLSIDVDLQSAYGVVKYQSAAQLANPPEDINRTAIDMSASVLDSRIVVNENAPHAVRGAGGYLVMTADGEYPAEMVNSVQVGRQLPMRAVTYMWPTSTVYTQVTRNDTLDDSPGGGISGYLISAKAGSTAVPHYVQLIYDAFSMTVNDPARFDVFLKPYPGAPRRVQLQVYYGNASAAIVGTAELDPTDGKVYNVTGGVKAVKVIQYGAWFRFSVTYDQTMAVTAMNARLLISDSTLTNFSFASAGGTVDSVYVAGDRLMLDPGTVPSVVPDSTRSSPESSISILKAYGAASAHVILSNGATYDLDFGDADRVDLPVNPYDVGDAYITRIEYRG